MYTLSNTYFYKAKGSLQLQTRAPTYIWTWRSPLLLVICHVNPLSGSKPGCEISSLYFLTCLMYLQSNHISESPTKHDMKKWSSEDRSYILISVKMINSKVLIPDKYILIGCHDIRVQESFSIPPRGQDNHKIFRTTTTLNIETCKE